MNEMKRYKNPISSSRFTAFGLGRGGSNTMRQNLQLARERILNSTQMTLAEKNTLIQQIDNHSAQIRIVARRSLVSEETRDLIQEGTGFITRVGF